MTVSDYGRSLWSPIYREVAGCLRGADFLVTLSNLDEFQFPLDRQIAVIVERESAILEECLSLVVDFSQLLPACHEIRRAIDDLIEVDPAGYYTRQNTQIELSILAGEREELQFSFDDASVLAGELSPMFRRQIRMMFDIAFRNRVNFFRVYPDAVLPPAARIAKVTAAAISAAIPTTA